MEGMAPSYPRGFSSPWSSSHHVSQPAGVVINCQDIALYPTSRVMNISAILQWLSLQPRQPSALCGKLWLLFNHFIAIHTYTHTWLCEMRDLRINISNLDQNKRTCGCLTAAAKGNQDHLANYSQQSRSSLCTQMCSPICLTQRTQIHH